MVWMCVFLLRKFYDMKWDNSILYLVGCTAHSNSTAFGRLDTFFARVGVNDDFFVWNHGGETLREYLDFLSPIFWGHDLTTMFHIGWLHHHLQQIPDAPWDGNKFSKPFPLVHVAIFHLIGKYSLHGAFGNMWPWSWHDLWSDRSCEAMKRVRLRNAVSPEDVEVKIPWKLKNYSTYIKWWYGHGHRCSVGICRVCWCEMHFPG